MTGLQGIRSSIDPALVNAPTRPPGRITTREGWRAHLERHVPAQPPLVEFREVQTWPKQDQQRYAAIRKRYMSMLPPVSTKDLVSIRDHVVRLAVAALDMPSGVRTGVVLDGHPTLGKSTIAVEIGRAYESALRRRDERDFGSKVDDLFTPVVYVTLSEKETPKSLYMKLLDFSGEPYSRQDSAAFLALAVANAFAKGGTSLVLIDDIHFLNARLREGMTVNQQLKSLGSSTNATYCYIGVDIEKTGLLYDGQARGQAQYAQTQARFKKLDVRPLARDDDEFIKLLSQLEGRLLLLNGRPDDLVGLHAYVHDRTRGLMGAVTTLVRESSAIAIDTGSERISKSIMDAVILDHASEAR